MRIPSTASRSRGAILVLLLGGIAIAAAADLSTIAAGDSVAALKQALSQGASKAVEQLGTKDGFLENPKVKIKLPSKLQKAEKLLHNLGMGEQADDLVTAMNRAAEAAVPEAKPLLVDAVKQMTLADARQILTGGDDAATQYFRKVSYDKLQQKFLPIVKEHTDKAELTQQYNTLVGEVGKLGLASTKDPTVEGYVTRKALDGLFLMVAEEERAIRKDPLGQSSKLLKTVFGALGGA
jgi:hypothetical protein